MLYLINRSIYNTSICLSAPVTTEIVLFLFGLTRAKAFKKETSHVETTRHENGIHTITREFRWLFVNGVDL